jgi:DNA topoisomerase-1
VKWEKINATIPDTIEPEDLTIGQAVDLIAERAAKAGKKIAPAKKKAPAKKTAAKKPAAEKAAPKKKAATKKPTAKKAAPKAE